MAQGGDFNFGNGNMGEAIYGKMFRDEAFLYKHSRRGLLSMARAYRRHTNNSNFFLTFDACNWCDGSHVVFGQVVEGFKTLEAMELAGTEGGFPQKLVEVFDCGEYDRTRHAKRFAKQLERPEAMEYGVDTYNPIPEEVYKHNYGGNPFGWWHTTRSPCERTQVHTVCEQIHPQFTM